MKKYNFIHTVKPFIVSTMIRLGIVIVILCIGGYLQAQEKMVSGVVRDAATGKPLMGVQIKVADQTASAITDSLGAYSIKVRSFSDLLIAGAPDYASREIPLQGRQSVDLQLFSALFSSGYGTIESLSGSKRKTLSSQAAGEAAGFWAATPLSIDSKLQDLLGGDVRAIHRSGLSGIAPMHSGN